MTFFVEINLAITFGIQIGVGSHSQSFPNPMDQHLVAPSITSVKTGIGDTLGVTSVSESIKSFSETLGIIYSQLRSPHICPRDSSHRFLEASRQFLTLFVRTLF